MDTGPGCAVANKHINMYTHTHKQPRSFCMPQRKATCSSCAATVGNSTLMRVYGLGFNSVSDVFLGRYGKFIIVNVFFGN